MWTSLRRIPALVLMSLLLAATSYADDKGDGRDDRPSVHGPIFDVTHFDVIPLAPPQVDIDFQQKAYGLLFKYRDASQSDPGLESFRIVNWIVASNHSQIIDVWKSIEAFNQHLAQAHSVDFRFNVQNNPDLCCIGSPIDDRQYSLVRSFNTPWTSNSLPATVGPTGALFVVTYVDFLQEVLEGDPNESQEELVGYGAATSKMNGQHLLNYTILQQLDRPNRFAILEVWDTQLNYASWQGSVVTTTFIAQVAPLLGSPFDHRLNILCGETFDDKLGCTPP
jgi:quinol monooxygenase YgiN